LPEIRQNQRQLCLQLLAALCSETDDSHLRKSAYLLLAFAISGCAATPEQMERAEQYDRYAKASRERAAMLGERPGTPETIDQINEANAQADSFERQSNEADDTVSDGIISIIIDWWLK
jgi:hypothetical protein